MSTELKSVKLAELHPAPWNPRHDLGDLTELVGSIKAKGLLQPLTVRPNNTGFEVLCGHRRLAAAKKAGLEEVAVIVRALDDREALEVALIDNIQRRDIDAVSEGEGLRVLHDEHGITVKDLAAKIGKSPAHVYARIKVASGLCKEIRNDVLAGKLSASEALLYARVHNPELQLRAFNEVAKLGQREGEPLSVRAVGQYLQEHYMLRLAEAPFDPKDANLVPGAGACAPCPKLAGNQPELFGDVKGKEVCTDPGCFDSKKRAAWQKRAAEAEEKGQRILNEKELEHVFDRYDGDISYNSPYVRPSEKCYEDAKHRTYAQLLGKDGPPKVLAQDRAGGAVELVDKHQAIEHLRRAGKLARDQFSGGRERTPTEKAEVAKAKLKNAAVTVALGEVAEAAARATLDDDFWRGMFSVIFAHGGWHDSFSYAVKRRGWAEKGKRPEQSVTAKLPGMNAGEVRGLMFEIAAGSMAYFAWGSKWSESLRACAKLLHVNLDKCESRARANASAKKPAKKSKAAGPIARKAKRKAG